eukprot:CAMPEP_0181092670 /NCGR_PEP_ID=MMETSP1071-20121207/9039_1 /TAXON_ID=35127 /ORGANISM="Thalassiosira sp., Strain NH16" /LENGTH=313 /DNA_ID=CAMNT_0023174859 /DNA_START=214 /DNA_END=1155 /DNA_ORIENTATION=+
MSIILSRRRLPLDEQSSSSPQTVPETSCNGSRIMPEAASPRQRTARSHIRHRRKLKSALFFALTILACSCSQVVSAFSNCNQSGLSQRKHEWIERSVRYYSNVMKKNSASTQPQHNTQIDSATSISEVPLLSNGNSDIIAHHGKDFVGLANKHYYARFLIKRGKWDFAEKIYRRIIDELTSESDEDDHCDHTKLAVSTLLLALHVQRTGDVKATRAVFINFFRRVALVKEGEEEDHKCSCSAKVLQAYALFEMKNGHSAKSLEIIQRAVKMDEELKPVLGWKQFRDAAAGREYSPTFSFGKSFHVKSTSAVIA